MYALQESMRQMRGSAAAQIPGPGTKISVCHRQRHFRCLRPIIMSNEEP
jgi:hypothetical protein